MKPLHESTLAVFGSEGKFWSNVGEKIEPMFRSILHVDPKVPALSEAPEATIAADVLFFSVPDAVFPDIVSEIGHLLHGKIVLENHTTKNLSLLKSMTDQGAQVCSIHTMVKTDSPHEGQPMIIMPCSDECDIAQGIALKCAEVLGMRTEQLPLHRHHAAVTTIQALEHLNARMKARAHLQHASASKLQLQQLDRLAPVSQRLAALGRDRILIQDPPVSANIMMQAKECIALMRRALDDIETAMQESRVALESLFAQDVAALGIPEHKAEIQKQTDDIIGKL